MKGQKTLSETAASPEQVLRIFQDWQRLEWGTALDSNQILSFDTKVEAWRDDCELKDWKQLGEELNKFFGTTFSKDDWRVAMEPERKKSLRDVCSLVASRASLPNLCELKVLGTPCRTASAFLALRSYLERSRLDTSKLRPSTKLDSWLRLHTQTVVEVIIKLDPGKLPRMTTTFNLGHRLSGMACLTGLIFLVVGGIWEKPEWVVTGCSVFALAFIAITAFSNLPPAAVRLDGLKTFGDVSRLIAGDGARDQMIF